MLQGFDVETFLRDYWQQRPLLIRGALPGFTGFLSVDEILAITAEEATPSRFFSETQRGLQGPFELDSEVLPKTDWTVLVQSLETVFDEAWNLLDQFSFLPRARLDDVMVSYAVPGGGIGPHFDLYDVFLVQGEGTRRWRYGAGPVDESLDDEASGPYPFEADHDVEVGPGDILYLPPRVLHDGTAITACTTYSVGAAAPRHADLVGEYLAFLQGELSGLGGMYSDPGATRPSRRGLIPPRLQQETVDLMRRLPLDEMTVSTFLGRLLTAPKPHTVFVEDEAPEASALAQKCQEMGEIRLTPASRLLHDAFGGLFMNGLAFEVEGDLEPFLQLADTRVATLPHTFSDDQLLLLQDWIEAGFIVVR